jgi:hypothetical protein
MTPTPPFCFARGNNNLSGQIFWGIAANNFARPSFRIKGDEAMKRCCLLIFIAVLILGVTPTASAASKLVKDMIALDRIYIATLSLTGAEVKTRSKRLIILLVGQWRSFKKSHWHDFPEDRLAKVNFAEINQMIEDAARMARQNGNPAEIHEILGGIGITFLHLRQRNSIDYYLDYFTKFQESMEAMMMITKSKNRETLNGDNICTMKIRFRESMKYWNEAIKAPFNRELFSFSAARETKLKEYISNETQDLGILRQALENEDRAAIIQGADAVWAGFTRLYALFGDPDKIN